MSKPGVSTSRVVVQLPTDAIIAAVTHGGRHGPDESAPTSVTESWAIHFAVKHLPHALVRLSSVSPLTEMQANLVHRM